MALLNRHHFHLAMYQAKASLLDLNDSLVPCPTCPCPLEGWAAATHP
jgi:hypothetical protein